MQFIGVHIEESVYQRWEEIARRYARNPGNAPNYHGRDGSGLEIVLRAAFDALEPLLGQDAPDQPYPRPDLPEEDERARV